MPKLIVVPTPIGNLEDITLRALRVLKEADFILAEDTRKTGHMLTHYEIENSLSPYHKFNEHNQLENLFQRILRANSVALVSDAGTPGISDPGYLLVKYCIDHDVEVETLPGASALILAAVNAGLPNDRFVFEGFLPQKKGRNKRILALKEEPRTIIFYESPHRLLKTLNQLLELFEEERKVCVCRELTKLHEENFRGNFTDAIHHFSAKPIKGEIALVVEGHVDKNKKA